MTEGADEKRRQTRPERRDGRRAAEREGRGAADEHGVAGLWRGVPGDVRHPTARQPQGGLVGRRRKHLAHPATAPGPCDLAADGRAATREHRPSAARCVRRTRWEIRHVRPGAILRATIARRGEHRDTLADELREDGVHRVPRLLRPAALRSSPADRDGIRWRDRVQGSGDCIEESRVRVGREVDALARFRRDAAYDLNVERHLTVRRVRVAGVVVGGAVDGDRRHERGVKAGALQIDAAESAAELDDVDGPTGPVA